MAVEIRIISNERSDCGEGPIWNQRSNTVSWVDIAGQKWHQVEMISKAKTKTFAVPTVIGAIVERSGGGYFAAVKAGYASIDPTGKFSSEIDLLPTEERMNDAKVDSRGRFWAGSTALDFTLGIGKLHVLEPDLTMRVAETGLALPNGLGWSPDNTVFYLVDSVQRVMWRYDFAEESGFISNREVLINFPDDGSMPDGLCVAEDGTLIVAMWDGSRLEVFSPAGAGIETIPMPVKRPTSCTFAAGKTLIVTSAAVEQDFEQYPLSGLTLAVDGLQYSGLASAVFRG